MSDVKVLYCTTPVDKAEEVARALLERRLAACVNILPGARSLYWWKGEIRDDREALLIIKTAADRVEPMIEALGEVHPYEVPELIAIPVERGNPAYLAWVNESSRP